MPLRPDLTEEEASRICMQQCRAGCCQGALYLRLSAAEVVAFRARAAALGVEALVEQAADGSGTMGFLEHEGARCPMLDPVSFACRIYADRPQRCRAFPDRARPDCPISGD